MREQHFFTHLELLLQTEEGDIGSCGLVDLLLGGDGGRDDAEALAEVVPEEADELSLEAAGE